MSSILTTIGLLIAGLTALVIGAEMLVRGASRLATAMGISPLVVGLTVVAFGTSAPELAVSVQSTLGGQPDIALGNVVGSNILNVLLILGLSAMIAPLAVAQRLVWFDVPLMIGASGLVLLLGLDGRIGRLEGLALFLGAVAYTVFVVRQSRRESQAVQQEYAQEYAAKPDEPARPAVNLLLVVGGLVLLVLGARWLVDCAVAFARAFGVSELVIGLTIIAIGTSLPEVAASIAAALRKEQDIAVGNVVGSNLFNILVVLGGASALAPEGVPISSAALRFDIPVMLAVAVACLPIFYIGHRISRWEGALFFFYYLAYTGYLLMEANKHEALPTYSWVLGFFVLPLTAVTVAVLFWRAVRRQRAPAGAAQA